MREGAVRRRQIADHAMHDGFYTFLLNTRERELTTAGESNTGGLHLLHALYTTRRGRIIYERL